MRKNIFIFLLIFLFSGFVLTSVYAQDSNQNYNERWTCLSIKKTTDDETNPPDQKKELDRFIRWAHSVIVSTKPNPSEKPAPNSNTYIVECLQIPKTLTIPENIKKELNNEIPTEICTTGNSQIDKMIWNNDRYFLAQKIFSAYDDVNRKNYSKGYSFDGYYKTDLITKIEPANTNHYLKTDKNGDFTDGKFVYISHTWTWSEKNPLLIDRKLLAYNRFTNNNASTDSGRGAIQQNTFSFTFEGANKDCVVIAWDPYGRVFDSRSLEPIPESKVTLLKSRGGFFVPVSNLDVSGGYISNPQVTGTDGYFSFIVPDGTYKLNVEALGYTFSSTSKSINPNYAKIYSDIYYGEPIVQKGAMVHRDIPLSPIDDNGKKYPPRLIGLFQTSVSNGTTIVEGRVSHPLSMVKGYCKTINGLKSTFNDTVSADKNGHFKLGFDPNRCKKDEGEMYAILDIESVDLTSLTSSMPSVFSKVINWLSNKAGLVQATVQSTTSYTLDPIPNYLEGYAYDEKNNVIPQAVVGLYAIGDKYPYKTVYADNRGKFKIMSDDIPHNPYKIQYTSPQGEKVTLSTTQFISQNLATIKKNRINLYAYKSLTNPVQKNNQPDQLTKQSDGGSNKNLIAQKNNENIKDTNISTANISQNNQNKNIMIFVITLLLLVGIAGLILGIYILKKK